MRALAIAVLVVLVLGIGSIAARAQQDDPIYRDTHGVCQTTATQNGRPWIIHCGVMPGYR